MLSLFCSHLQFVIVSDQDIEKKNNEKFMSSWYLIWQTFEEVARQKIKPNEDAIIYNIHILIKFIHPLQPK